jgi:hypothetical protein
LRLLSLKVGALFFWVITSARTQNVIIEGSLKEKNILQKPQLVKRPITFRKSLSIPLISSLAISKNPKSIQHQNKSKFDLDSSSSWSNKKLLEKNW